MMLSTRAWLAAREGDREAEQSALEEIVALEPANDAAIERLADLSAQAREPGKVAELRRRKAAIDAAIDDYKRLIELPEMPAHAAEFARTAEAIGLWFEAKTWWALAVRRDPSVADEARAAIARLAAHEESARPVDGPSSGRSSRTQPARWESGQLGIARPGRPHVRGRGRCPRPRVPLRPWS